MYAIRYLGLLSLFLCPTLFGTTARGQMIHVGMSQKAALQTLMFCQQGEGIMYDYFFAGVQQWGLTGSLVMNVESELVSTVVWVSDTLPVYRIDKLADSIRDQVASKLGDYIYTDMLGVPRWTWKRGAVETSVYIESSSISYQEIGPEDRAAYLARVKLLESKLHKLDSLQHLQPPK